MRVPFCEKCHRNVAGGLQEGSRINPQNSSSSRPCGMNHAEQHMAGVDQPARAVTCEHLLSRQHEHLDVLDASPAPHGHEEPRNGEETQLCGRRCADRAGYATHPGHGNVSREFP